MRKLNMQQNIKKQEDEVNEKDKVNLDMKILNK